MSAETDRLDALEAWVDAVTPTLRALARRALAMPDKNQAGADAGLLALDDGVERAAVVAAVPRRA